MTREDIIRMAREAGLTVGTNISGVMLVGSPAEIGLAHISIEEMERFAALVAIKVAASEREWMQETNIKLIAEAVAAEREACMKIVKEYQIPVGNSPAGELACDWTYEALKQIRDEIRERGVK
jgi:hypothetical protein